MYGPYCIAFHFIELEIFISNLTRIARRVQIKKKLGEIKDRYTPFTSKQVSYNHPTISRKKKTIIIPLSKKVAH
jgi:hypothetical protein